MHTHAHTYTHTRTRTDTGTHGWLEAGHLFSLDPSCSGLTVNWACAKVINLQTLPSHYLMIMISHPCLIVMTSHPQIRCLAFSTYQDPHPWKAKDKMQTKRPGPLRRVTARKWRRLISLSFTHLHQMIMPWTRKNSLYEKNPYFT